MSLKMLNLTRIEQDADIVGCFKDWDRTKKNNNCTCTSSGSTLKAFSHRSTIFSHELVLKATQKKFASSTVTTCFKM